MVGLSIVMMEARIELRRELNALGFWGFVSECCYAASVKFNWPVEMGKINGHFLLLTIDLDLLLIIDELLVHGWVNLSDRFRLHLVLLRGYIFYD